jgi:hypothetical protein
MSLKWQFLLNILLHLLDLVLNNDGLVDHPLEILVVCVDIIWRIPWQLSKSVEILIHGHTALLQFGEFLLLVFERTTGYVVSSKPSFELIPSDSTNIRVRVAVSLPPILNGSK